MKYIKEFICDPLPTPNCHASTVLPLGDGSVLAAWFGGTKESSADVDIWAVSYTHLTLPTNSRV